jgi:hypothetical protein
MAPSRFCETSMEVLKVKGSVTEAPFTVVVRVPSTRMEAWASAMACRPGR